MMHSLPVKLISIASAIANFAATPNPQYFEISSHRYLGIGNIKNIAERESLDTEADSDLQQGIEHDRRGEFP